MPEKESGAVSANAFLKPGPHFVIPGFLGPEKVSWLLDYAAERKADFEPSRIVGKGHDGDVNPAVRISSRLESVREVEPLIIDRVRQSIRDVFSALGTPAFEPVHWEIEIVAHNHGAFFKRHVDTIIRGAENSDVPPKSVRAISLVYYFSRTPPRFSGGELRLMSLAETDAPGSSIDIAPVCDTALFFPSWFPHEVQPVTCESREFLDSRFAINCWIYK